MGLLREVNCEKLCQAVHDHVAQGLRRRPFHQRLITPPAPSSTTSNSPSTATSPISVRFRVSTRRLRVGRQIHDPQPRAVLSSNGGAGEVQLRRCHRSHAHPKAASTAQTLDRHAVKDTVQINERLDVIGHFVEEPTWPTPCASRWRWWATWKYRVAYRRGAGVTPPGTGAAQEFAFCGRIAQGGARIHGRRPIACAGGADRPDDRRGARPHRAGDIPRSAQQPDSKGGVIADGVDPELTTCAASRPRQGLPGTHPAARERDDGHPKVAQDPLQQRLRLLYRSAQRP